MTVAASAKTYLLLPWRYRALLRQFVRREILGRYRGSVLGMAWMFLSPLLMLAVYTFVFVGIFKARWPGAEQAGGIAFALRLFAGLMIFNMFADVVSRSAGLVLEQPNLVKKVVFPLELLAFVSLGTALFHFTWSVLILLAGVTFLEGGLQWSVLLFPVVIAPLFPLLLGLSWLLSALGVYVRDVSQMVGLVVSFLLFLTPVFYSLHNMAPEWQFWMGLNPMTYVIENVRTVVFTGNAPDWGVWGISMVAGLGVAALGAWVFSILRDGFADVI